MEVFLKIPREDTTIVVIAKESDTVLQVKRMLGGGLKRPPKEQLLYKDDQLLEDRKTLRDYGLTSHVATPHDPAILTLAFPEDASQVLHPNPDSLVH